MFLKLNDPKEGIMDTHTTVSYNKLPNVLMTEDDLYSLIVVVAQIFRSQSYADRMAKIGISYLDLADDYYLSYLEGRTKPTKRFPVRNGVSTRPAVELALPIEKTTAYTIVKFDLLTVISRDTPEERANVVLESIEQQEERHTRRNDEGN
jgi:hypothetical protein